MTNTDEITIITVEELCDRLMISESVAYRLLKNNQIHAFKIGSTWKIPSYAVDKYILSQCSK